MKLKYIDAFHDLSSDIKKQGDYIRAQNAIIECSQGNIASFNFIQQIVQEEPFNSRGLDITETDYKRLKSEYEMWKAGREQD